MVFALFRRNIEVLSAVKYIWGDNLVISGDNLRDLVVMYKDWLESLAANRELKWTDLRVFLMLLAKIS